VIAVFSFFNVRTLEELEGFQKQLDASNRGFSVSTLFIFVSEQKAC
jgi:hypothetical protein